MDSVTLCGVTRLKPGDLVHPHRFSIELYSEKIFSEINEMNRYADISFEPDEIGMILEMISFKGDHDSDILCKVLVPNGIGYTFEWWMRVVKQ